MSDMTTGTETASRALARWRMNEVTAKDVVKLDVAGKISDVLALLNKVDGISADILITIHHPAIPADNQPTKVN